MYKQCKLTKGKWHQYAWIPEKYAKKGKVLRIKDEGGWLVVGVFATESEEVIKARERGYKHWRSVTDI
jgi:hypothetical protein